MSTPVRLLVGAACVVALACRTGNAGIDYGETPVQNTVDTVRGVLSTVGSEPIVEVVITPAAGEKFVIVGGQTARLRSLGKVEVMLAGRYPGLRSMTAAPRGLRAFEADKFTVRSADGVPAYDGVVVKEADHYFLISSNGHRWPADHMPEMLRRLPGARVFLAGPLDRDPVSYGIISEPGR
ncbi:MAG: hypothetical protein JWM95_2501 [Gemmatimonadetes bacterium]|nr:hypothetical protein [Gemmatimonadota bacterium]